MTGREGGTIRSRFIPVLFEYLRETGHDVAAFAARHGVAVNLDPLDPVPWQLFAEVVADAEEELGEPFLGLRMAQSLRRGSYGVLEFATRTAPDIRSALDRLVRYQRLVSDRVAFAAVERGADISLEQRISGVPRSAERHPNEYSVCVFVRRMRELGDPAFAPRQAYFTHARPARVDELVAFLGTERIEFGHECNGMLFPSALLDRPVRSADPELLPVLDEHARRLLIDLPQVADLAGTVREAIHKDLLDGMPDVQRVARRLHMSARTLQRRLAEDGTSFQDLVDRMRHQLAERHLQNAALSVGEIAYLLGYSDTRAFLRAFKRWTGTTPGEYRTRARSP